MMKLLKSIEKAKQQRQEAIRAASTEAYSTEKEFNKQEWIPPVYSESKSIELDFEKLAENRCISVFPNIPEAESYKILRTNIQQRASENKWNTLMVTSAHPGEGKTLTTINLALSFAKEFDNTVLLVDCDFKRQSIHQYLNFSSKKGIVDYLTNNCQLKDLTYGRCADYGVLFPNQYKKSMLVLLVKLSVKPNYDHTAHHN